MAGSRPAPLECGVAELAGRAADSSFATLGGTSLRAIEFAAMMARHHGLAIDVTALGREPLAEVVAAASPVGEPGPGRRRRRGRRGTPAGRR